MTFEESAECKRPVPGSASVADLAVRASDGQLALVGELSGTVDLGPGPYTVTPVGSTHPNGYLLFLGQ